MRWGLASVVPVLLSLALPAPAVAATQQVSITVAHRWGTPLAAGLWSPYTVTVHNVGAGTFEGDAVLVPNASQNGGFGPVAVQSLPTYRTHVIVPNGSDRSVTVYLVEANSGYHAELRDTNGTLVSSAQPASAPRAIGAVGVLSDVARAAQKISAPLSGLSQVNVAVAGFAGAQDFPSSAVELSGLNGLIVDQFDLGTLDQAQMRALRDFVGLGGALIEVGGASWRRTFSHIPSDLVPMAPSETAEASMSPVAVLAGQSSDASVQVATGLVAPWAHVAVAAPDSRPLVVEGAYGSGRLVEIAFDPLAPPLDTQPNLAVMSWAQAITRGLSGGARTGPGPGPVPPFGPGGPTTPLGGGGPGSLLPNPGLLWQVLNDSGTSAQPPLGLLAGLFGVYVLLLTLGLYVLLKAAGRRGLLWVAVPALAVAVTGGAYAAGLGGRASAVQLSQAQIQLAGPGGVVETYSYDGVWSPRKGDVSLALPNTTLASTAMPSYSGPGSGLTGGEVTLGASDQVIIPNVPVWEMRAVQTLSISHLAGLRGAGLPLAASLTVKGGRITGSVTNVSGLRLRSVRLASASASPVDVAPELGPGASVTVDAALPSASSAGLGKGIPGPGVSFCGPGVPCGQTAARSFLNLAAQQAAAGPSQLALVAQTDPIDATGGKTATAAGSTRALLIQPVGISEADRLGGLTPLGRLVSSYPAPGGGGQLDVYELALPPGTLTGGITLNTTFYQPAAQPAEVYDWDAGTWKASAQPGGPGAATPTRLSAGETRDGIVRVRVVENSPGQVGLSLNDSA
ncbi:MAG: hypothetical protein J2P45_02600 [Candidatus Dormibacteraeota bacterium]|nr:hypothetical protein [Candidatus Dormibacteraeota bacterium]